MVGLAPGLGSVSGSPDPLCGHTSRLRLFLWGMLLSLVLLDLVLGVGS
jgi:hypothetical protein